jgi:hypothetical protein
VKPRSAGYFSKHVGGVSTGLSVRPFDQDTGVALSVTLQPSFGASAKA